LLYLVGSSILLYLTTGFFIPHFYRIKFGAKHPTLTHALWKYGINSNSHTSPRSPSTRRSATNRHRKKISLRSQILHKDRFQYDRISKSSSLGLQTAGNYFILLSYTHTHTCFSLGSPSSCTQTRWVQRLLTKSNSPHCWKWMQCRVHTRPYSQQH